MGPAKLDYSPNLLSAAVYDITTQHTSEENSRRVQCVKGITIVCKKTETHSVKVDLKHKGSVSLYGGLLCTTLLQLPYKMSKCERQEEQGGAELEEREEHKEAVAAEERRR
ncbi:uncharacterized protein V6R79_025474 [Siganus canaliculatus]